MDHSFSALQRAENSSIYFRERDGRTAESVSVLFSEPKIPQSTLLLTRARMTPRFSALQRAENSSMAWVSAVVTNPTPFQCSSASRKFLNTSISVKRSLMFSVSVLFSEPKIPQSSPSVGDGSMPVPVSVLFSEPKIPQCGVRWAILDGKGDVSVLFSEPKIPQSTIPP